MATTLAVVFACVAALSGAYAWRITLAERRRSEARVAALAAAIDPSGAEDRPLFDRAPIRGVNPLLKVGAGFAVVMTIVGIIVVATNAMTRHAVTTADAPVVPAVALVQMNHQRQGDAFVVQGAVRNEGRADVDGLLAEITVLDAGGTAVARQHAPIYLQVLRPGESSRFEVRIQSIRTVDKYRVSFQGPSGVVRHVDAREHVARDTGSTPRAVAKSATASTGF
jgi:hypothetical protein